eukprot:jgi/Picsp_1/1873/NSC_05339-R1_elongator complex protein 4-like
MSSFIRRSGPSTPDIGTRPGPHGQRVISTGLDDLDKIFGGGIPLGGVCLIEEDGWTSHHNVLLKYFASEGVLAGQAVCLVAPQSMSLGLNDFVLKEMSKTEAEKEEAAEKASEEASRNDTKLRIAWQYEKFVMSRKQQELHSGSSREQPALSSHNTGLALSKGQQPVVRTRSPWCHAYDITKPPREDTLSKLQSNGSISVTVSAGQAAVKETVDAIQHFVHGCGLGNNDTYAAQSQKQKAHADTSIASSEKMYMSAGRVVIPSLAGLAWDDDASLNNTDLAAQRAIAILLEAKRLAQTARLCIMVTARLSQVSPSDRIRMMHIADSVMSLEAVDDTSQVVKLSTDSRTVSGLARICKLPAAGALVAPSPQVTCYIVRNKRKRLAISPIEIDPDAEAQLTEADAGPVSSALPCGAAAAVGTKQQQYEF